MKTVRLFAGLIALIALTMVLPGAVFRGSVSQPKADKRPNIVWIMAEDIGPQLNCYGDKLGYSPNIDKLAADGIRYTRAFTVYGVCAPSRNSIITGMYPSATGAMHMRQSKGLIPFPGIPDYNNVPAPDVKAFTEYLRMAGPRASGYYCTNNVKTDYQFGNPFTVWDESSKTAHWRNRPDKSQPFLSVFTFDITHEIHLWPDDVRYKFYEEQGIKRPVLSKDEAKFFALTPEEQVKPSEVPVPPYYPDTPLVREGIARYYDNIRRMDRQVGQVIQQLEEDGELDNTIIFFMGDNGNCQPRGKRWVLESGIQVPLILSGKRLKAHNKVDGQLVSGVDFAPTALYLAGVPIPANIHGQIISGIGPTKPRSYIFAARDRMDDTYDMIRAVRDKRYKYIKNFNPEKPYTQPIEFLYRNPMMADILRLEKEGKLSAVQQSWLFKTKPPVELYDIDTDPNELHNLADQPAQAARIKTMDATLIDWQKKYGDLGQVPETEMAEQMWPGGKQPVTQPPLLNRTGNVVTLTCPTPGASIGYQLADSKRWLLYSKPFSVAAGVPVRAKAVRYGWAESAVAGQ